MMRRLRSLTPRTAAFAAAFAAAGCGGHEFPPPDRTQRIADADTLFATISFDTVAWASDSVRAFEGNNIYAATCRRCHGPLGQGGTEYARNRELDVPSIVEPEADWGSDVAAVRHHIFVGHDTGMPTFGVATLTLREIDAVAFYLVTVLRPDVLNARDRG